MNDYSHVYNAHPSYIEEMYKKFKADATAVDQGWRVFFEGFDFAGYGDDAGEVATTGVSSDVTKEFGVFSMIQSFRSRGHLLSTTNPIHQRRDRKPHLDLSDYGLMDADLGKTWQAGKEIGLPNATLQQIIDKLKYVYCGNIGVEFEHITDEEKRNWIQSRVETVKNTNDFDLSIDKKKQILKKLNGAVGFEKFLHTKYVGQKRFSLEGGESTIAALDAIITAGSEQNVQEVVIGMAHRGRLNVLANIMGKTYEHIFNEFEGNVVPDLSFGDGDVKYHLGYSSQVETNAGKEVYLKLVPNPSHLESVDPVLEGFARAKADLLYGGDYDKILPILIHGDAAVAGQGVVYETVQMGKLDGYYTGGTIHYVINNQIGFTTDWDDARSSTYCTAAAHVVEAPVFHVNGDDPEAVVYVAELAAAYRQKFNSDVFIDMVCYRKHGHNEGDDPKFTQPEMYEHIKSHDDPRALYVNKLVSRGDVEKNLAQELEKEFWNDLQSRLDAVKQKPLKYVYQDPELDWKKLKKTTDASDYETSPKTSITKKTASHILEHILTFPEGFTPLSKFNRLVKGARKLMDKDVIDWGMAEMAAYGSILMEGKNVRMSGQDVKRGTFSHRHAVLRDAKTYQQYNRLSELSEDQGKFMIYNSLLSEFAVMGFEYGYSLATPSSLVIWEAQFGDFYNGAQTIVDQYISAAESKWRRMSGLVLLLPHGYAGQGPEHSSARVERFLQSCAEYNMTVVNCTTPANFFHVIRRQLERPFRKPLVVMSPKSLLRHPKCVSSMSDIIGSTKFSEVYDDASADPKKVKRLLLCSGKVYYDLLAEKEAKAREDIAIIRLEQLYPFPEKQLRAIFAKYNNPEMFWVQEEPANMGSWLHILRYLRKDPIELISRKVSASPATGFKNVHDMQQSEIIEKAFA